MQHAWLKQQFAGWETKVWLNVIEQYLFEIRALVHWIPSTLIQTIGSVIKRPTVNRLNVMSRHGSHAKVHISHS